MSAYSRWVMPALTRVDAERSHELATAALRAATAPPGSARALRRRLGPADPVLRTRALGLEFDSPLGLAAGFDKDARTLRGLWALGFGHLEIGTVTALPQPGQARPRVFRLPADRALINRMGFPNRGAAAAAGRLAGRPDGIRVGVNIGRSRSVANADAVADHRAAARAVAPVADYVVVNVSSPNTPGVRDLQAVEMLSPLLDGVRAELDEVAGRRVPLLVKLSPDLDGSALDALADLALARGLDGLIATNTTLGRDGLTTPPGHVRALGAGGLSGAPLSARALAVLRRLRRRAGPELCLIAAGGIGDADSAWARITAGATLVQTYTGFVYGGPGWVNAAHRGLAARVRAAGLRSVDAAVGSDPR